MSSLDKAKRKLEVMLTIQSELNQAVDANWSTKGFRWEDATMASAYSLFDKLPWRWWKTSVKPADLAQLQGEVTDTWRFILSRAIEDHGIVGAPDQLILAFKNRNREVFGAPIDAEVIKNAVRSFLSNVTLAGLDPKAANQQSYLPEFVGILDALHVSLDALFTTYVSRTQLNRFRRANGYGTTYVKIWAGKEDSAWLAEFVKTLDADAADFRERVSAGLAAQYKKVAVPAAAPPPQNRTYPPRSYSQNKPGGQKRPYFGKKGASSQRNKWPRSNSQRSNY
jgi:hypothetical protein